jgi:hypothetical protein
LAVTCAPIYSARHGLSTQVPLGPDEGLKHESAVYCAELVSLQKPALTGYVGTLSESRLRELNRCLKQRDPGSGVLTAAAFLVAVGQGVNDPKDRLSVRGGKFVQSLDVTLPTNIAGGLRPSSVTRPLLSAEESFDRDL